MYIQRDSIVWPLSLTILRWFVCQPCSRRIQWPGGGCTKLRSHLIFNKLQSHSAGEWSVHSLSWPDSVFKASFDMYCYFFHRHSGPIFAIGYPLSQSGSTSSTRPGWTSFAAFGNATFSCLGSVVLQVLARLCFCIISAVSHLRRPVGFPLQSLTHSYSHSNE